MPLLQIGCSAQALSEAQWQLIQTFIEQLQACSEPQAGDEWLSELVAALPTCVTPGAWLDAFRTQLAVNLDTLLGEQTTIMTKLRSAEAHCAWYKTRCVHCPERHQAAEVEQWQVAYAALAQDLKQAQTSLEQITTVLAHERQAHAATRARLEAQVAAQNALIVKLREELKARA